MVKKKWYQKWRVYLLIVLGVLAVYLIASYAKCGKKIFYSERQVECVIAPCPPVTFFCDIFGDR